MDQKYLESSEICWKRMNKFLGRLCEKWRNITKSLGGRLDWPHILRRNCLLNHVIEGKLEEIIEGAGR